MNIHYFAPEFPGDNGKSKEDKGLLSREKLSENAQIRAQKINKSKSNNGLLSKNENKLLTNDGREIFNENKK